MRFGTSSRYLVTITLTAILTFISAHPETKYPHEEHLKFVLVLSRHGVRSPTWTNERLDEYSKEPWPAWDVAPGFLTPHGRKLMTLFGSYYHQSFASRGLLQADGCADLAHVYIYTDSDQRTIETGRGLADGLFPGCHPLIHSRENGQPDALFHFEGKSGNVDAGLAYSALAGRIGDDPAATVPAYLAQLQAMRTLLLGCDNSSCKPDGKKDLLTIPPLLEPGKGDRLVDLKGPLSTAATFAENLQLEYLQGMTGNQLAWGHMDEAGILSLMALHSASSDLAQRTPYIARVQASNLLAHILATVQQAEEAHLVTGAIGPPGNKVVFLVGHDTNIANVAALLDAHWLVEGYQRDDAAPGGAIVIELWQNAGGVDELRTYYVAQTPDQMRTATPLSLANPPGNATVFLPACSQKGEGSPCAWPAFRHMLESVIDHSLVQ